MFRTFIVLFCIFFIHASFAPAWADKPPLPQRKTVSLDTIQQQLKTERLKRSEIKGSLKNAEIELESTKTELVKIGEAVRSQEKLLSALQQRIAENMQESAALQDSLQNDFGSISELILTLTRLRQLPPEAIIARPATPIATARSAMILKDMLETINSRAGELSRTLDSLNKMREELSNDRAQAQETKAILDAKYADVSSLASKRVELHKKLNKDYSSSNEAIERLAREAENLQELINKLQDDDTQEQYRRKSQPEVKSVHAAHSYSKGDLRMPVYGPVLISFGEKDKIGAESKGMTIEGQPRASVISPKDGVVKFSGNFKDYGNIVIIEHDDQYHSLIIGLEKISVVSGQQLDAGEPVGRLPSSSSRGCQPTLYYELRRKGQPVDPAGKFAELKS